TEDEYNSVRDELKQELKAVLRVREYFAALRQPLEKSGQSGRVDLKTLTNELVKDLKIEPDSNATAKGFEIASKIGGTVGNVFGTDAKKAVKSISGVLGLIAYFTKADGRPTLADTVQAKATDLGGEIQQRLFDAEAETATPEALV